MQKKSRVNSANICLIGGSGRSGTTILKKIFTRHPEVACIPEWRFTIDPDGLVDFFNTFSAGWSPYLFDIKLNRLEKFLKAIGGYNFLYHSINSLLFRSGLHQRLPWKFTPAYADIHAARYCPHYFELVDELIKNLTEFRYRSKWTGASAWQSTLALGGPFSQEGLAAILGNFFRKVVVNTVQSQRATYYVEDNTWNILWFDRILLLTPEARLVHIYRDPRDVVASYTQQVWAPSDPAQAAQFYKSIMSRWWEVKATLPSHTFMEIALEALVKNPKEILINLCRFWDIPWNDVLLETDLSHAHSGRWERDFDKSQQHIISEILEDSLFRLGYI